MDIYDAATGLWSTARLSEARWDLVATSVGTKAIFAGGLNTAGEYSATVDIFDVSTGNWTVAALSEARNSMAQPLRVPRQSLQAGKGPGSTRTP